MKNKEKLKLINFIEEIKEVVVNSYKYKDNLDKLPKSLKNKYSTIYENIKKNNPLNEFPLLSNLLRADSLIDVIRAFINSNFNEKFLWNDSYEHAISEINITDYEKGVFTTPHDLNGRAIGDFNDHIRINKIKLKNFRFFIDDKENNTFELNGKNMLLYGENGGGKSSLYKAFDLLSKIGKEDISKEFEKNKNIFKIEEPSSIIFEFSNGDEIDINDDSEIENEFSFIKTLSVFQPLLDYKELLKVVDVKNSNLYNFFELILEKYPIGNGLLLKNLKVNEDERYFDIFKKILDKELFEYINIFLKQFKQNFQLIDISFSPTYKNIFLKMEYFEQEIEDYQLFLNEARLSALAMSVHFSIIKKQFSLLDNDSLKILVLDDLLISLDMNNRLNLLDIFKTEFSDFQIFFFTHDKGLFEVFKNKIDAKSYEIYADISKDGYEIPFIKKYNSLLEQAKYQKLHKNFDCSANLLRQYTEKLICNFLPINQQVDKSCKQLSLSPLIDKAISFDKQNKSTTDLFSKLQTYRIILFNIASHNDDTNIYENEINEALETLEKLKIELSL